MIRVEELSKHFRVHRRPAGFGAALKSIFRRDYKIVKAVDQISFRIERGERVGFLGPNGAGKTTTLKVLSGLLHPTSGEVAVGAFEPRRRDPRFLQAITLVMGQKSQLIWDLPPAETFELNRAIFGVPRDRFDETMNELSELLGLEELVTVPTRQLSLGERMKCELAAALLHHPTTLFLDEPTIGLDVSMQLAIRDFIRSYNRRHEATVLLTSHYMDDVTALCSRVIVIDEGTIIYDGDLRQLVKEMDPNKLVSLTTTGPVPRSELEKLGEVVELESTHAVMRVASSDLREVVAHALASLPVADLSVEDPPLEDVLRQLFADRKSSDEASAAS